jgi:hypothetical protein
MNEEPVNKEAFKMLAMEIGLNEAARKLEIPIPTAKSWARRGKWNLPRRKGGGVSRSLSASIASSPHPIADALGATHKNLEDATKTALMQALTKAARAVAGKDALDISNTAQLRDICLAAARIFGWQGDSHVSVAVNAQQALVITDAKRAELQEKLKRLQESAPLTLPEPQTQPEANVTAGNDSPAPDSKQEASSAPAGAKDPTPSPSYLIWRDYKRPEEEQEDPTADINNVGW